MTDLRWGQSPDVNKMADQIEEDLKEVMRRPKPIVPPAAVAPLAYAQPNRRAEQPEVRRDWTPLGDVANAVTELRFHELMEMATAITSAKDYKPPTVAHELAALLSAWAIQERSSEA